MIDDYIANIATYMCKTECYGLALAMADECVIKCVRVFIEASLNFMGYNLRLYFAHFL